MPEVLFPRLALIGVGLIYMMTGTLNLADMAQRIQEVADLRPILVTMAKEAREQTSAG